MKSLKDQGFIFHTLEQKPDYEGRVIATLIEKKAAKVSKNAFLYLHGFNDYFFQVHLADWANQQGMNFYALELRKYGRSILPHQKPNDFRDYHEYFEDIDSAIDFIKSKDKNEKLIFMGHSTGGLLAALYADEHKNNHLIDLLILNSPFFEFNIPPFLKKTFLPFMTSIGKYFHGVASPVGLDKGYGFSLHKSHFGEWDYDLSLKPDAGFKIHASWIRAIHLAHTKLQQGLDIQCPVLVMYSRKSVKPGNYRPDMQGTDSVLNVKEIEAFSNDIGKKVQQKSFDGGVHDLTLSKQEVRDRVFKAMAEFIKLNNR
ncbi:MAG: alpha/beta hydrolase [Bacteroidales bacterium]|nr:alpha/beta hydrolase [Bacteroidales bacterium]